ncbi:hypothetical protein CSUI_008996 [Cystoisospora suis]|uniref:Uncharacterized protein n=1 Tax=Cystoisospora suis TaxID=483139 RepID=A0A2C6K638_9APIC|nr:hypothetical protein CSUI_008996 [Cystoisospora suis]
MERRGELFSCWNAIQRRRKRKRKRKRQKQQEKKVKKKQKKDARVTVNSLNQKNRINSLSLFLLYLSSSLPPACMHAM